VDMSAHEHLLPRGAADGKGVDAVAPVSMGGYMEKDGGGGTNPKTIR